MNKKVFRKFKITIDKKKYNVETTIDWSEVSDDTIVEYATNNFIVRHVQDPVRLGKLKIEDIPKEIEVYSWIAYLQERPKDPKLGLIVQARKLKEQGMSKEEIIKTLENEI